MEAPPALCPERQSVLRSKRTRLSHLLTLGAEDFSSLRFGYNFSLLGKVFCLCLCQERIQDQERRAQVLSISICFMIYNFWLKFADPLSMFFQIFDSLLNSSYVGIPTSVFWLNNRITRLLLFLSLLIYVMKRRWKCCLQSTKVY